MITRRINAGACTLGENHIYVFGGRSEGDEFYETIERYNLDLNLWNMLHIKLPNKLSNLFAFHFSNNNEDNIIIFGGVKKVEQIHKAEMQ